MKHYNPKSSRPYFISVLAIASIPMLMFAWCLEYLIYKVFPNNKPFGLELFITISSLLFIVFMILFVPAIISALYSKK